MSLPPPGIVVGSEFSELASSGVEHAWQTLPPRKDFTNAFVFAPGKVLLGYKKRGFGKGLWNGFGGKVDSGESSLQAACRELKEEACVDAPLEHCGTLLFTTEGAPYSHYIDYYRAETFSSEPEETEEMRPAWFSTIAVNSVTPPAAISLADTEALRTSLERHTLAAASDSLPAVPYDLMWPDDRFWFPVLIEGRRFIGRADFVADPAKSDGWIMQRYWFAATSR